MSEIVKGLEGDIQKARIGMSTTFTKVECEFKRVMKDDSRKNGGRW
jgi:hypothetical protein